MKNQKVAVLATTASLLSIGVVALYYKMKRDNTRETMERKQQIAKIIDELGAHGTPIPTL